MQIPPSPAPSSGSEDGERQRSFTVLCWRLAIVACLAVTGWRVAMLMAAPVNLSFDEAQYWGWAQHLDWGYFSKPPMVAWAIWATTHLAGSDAEVWVRLSSPLAHAGIALTLFALSRHLFSPRVAVWVAATWLTLPGVSLSAMLVSTDPPLLLFWSLSLFAYVRALDIRGADAPVPAAQWPWWLALGLFAGLGLLSKYAMAFFLFGVACHMILVPAHRRRLWAARRQAVVALLLSVMLYTPNFWWNQQHQFASYRHTGENANLGTTHGFFHPLALGEFLGSQFAVMGPLLFAAFLLLAFRYARQDLVGKEERLLLAAFCLPPLLLIAVQALLSRANANWAATAYVAAVPLVVSWLVQEGRLRGVLRLSLLLHLLAMAALPHVYTLAQDLGLSKPSRFDLQKRVRGWDHAGTWLKDLHGQSPELPLLFVERKTYATLLYYSRPLVEGAWMLNPQRHTKNHYELLYSLPDNPQQRGKDFLFISRDPIDGLRPYFTEITPLSVFREAINEKDELTLTAYRARGFLGYDPLSTK